MWRGAGCSLSAVRQRAKKGGGKPTALVTIGAARHSDGDWCARLMAATEPWITLRQDLAACRAKLSRPGNELFVARQERERVGFILVHPYGLAGSPYVKSIAVVESRRSQGLGAQMIAYVAKHFAARRHLFLCVSSFNRRAQALYRKLGFKRVGEFPDYIVPGHSEILFCKKLP